MNLQTLFEAFSEMGERHSLDIRGGPHLEGQILEVSEQFLVFFAGGPLASEQPMFIQLQDVDLQTLFFWDNTAKRYVQACWDENNVGWLLGER